MLWLDASRYRGSVSQVVISGRFAPYLQIARRALELILMRTPTCDEPRRENFRNCSNPLRSAEFPAPTLEMFMRVKVMIPVLFVGLAVALSACIPPPSAVTGATPADVVNAINGDRAANGLGALTSDPQLEALAKAWANHLAAVGTLGHQDLEALRANPYMSTWLSLGENCLTGAASLSAGQIENVWMSDSGHRENILRPGMNAVGVGMTVDGAGQVWVVADFGRR
jgi:uncharacterized protein YkwD